MRRFLAKLEQDQLIYTIHETLAGQGREVFYAPGAALLAESEPEPSQSAPQADLAGELAEIVSNAVVAATAVLERRLADLEQERDEALAKLAKAREAVLA